MSGSPTTAAGSPEATWIWRVQAGREAAHQGLAVVRELTVGNSILFRMGGMQLCHDAALAAGAVAATECMPRPPSETLR